MDIRLAGMMWSSRLRINLLRIRLYRSKGLGSNVPFPCIALLVACLLVQAFIEGLARLFGVALLCALSSPGFSPGLGAGNARSLIGAAL
ncbi:hypothetical protein MTO96_042717 [Rhipicephalus appendiculatus]